MLLTSLYDNTGISYNTASNFSKVICLSGGVKVAYAACNSQPRYSLLAVQLI
jgi:hypothetical protein